MTQFMLSVQRKKKLSHFELKSWVTCGIMIRPGKVSNLRIFESIGLSMLSQLDSQCWVNWTLNVESIWLSMLSQFESQCWVNLTPIVEPIWLSMLSQLDSQCWVSLTLNVKSIWLLMLSRFDSNILQLPTLPGRILVPLVTHLFMSKWLNFFLSVYHSLQT